MAYYLCKLVLPRPSFLADMSGEERALMLAHQAYMRPHVDSGLVIAMGAVADPSGGWGLGLAETASRAELDAILDGDPIILAGQGFRFETHPIPQLTLGRGADRVSTFSVTP